MKKTVNKSEERNVWIIEKIESNFAKKTGHLGRAKAYTIEKDENGNEISEFTGEFDDTKLSNSKEDLAPLYLNRKWSFAGDDATLKELVKEIKLTYPESHAKSGEIITEANVNNEVDPFFSHPHWREGGRFVIRGGKQVVADDDPEFKFLLLCLKGGTRFISDEDVFEAAGSKFRILKSNVDKKSDVTAALDEMQMAVAVSGLTAEKAGLISLIMGLVLELDILDSDTLKANLLSNLKRKDKNPNGDIRLFGGKTYGTFFVELKDNDLAELNKKANIKRGLNKNILRYRDNGYDLRGSKIIANTFSELVTYFKSEDSVDDYNKLVDAINA